MTSKDIRDKYIKFFIDKRHKEIAPAKLVPENDPSTLFTSSGMQPLVPYLLGQEHPAGKRLVNSQPCFRAEDIEEVGDNRHTTFFEMLGNWSLGDYFKKEQLPWIWEFLTKELGLPKEKLYVSVFEGDKDVPKDEETYGIWKSLGVPEDHIYFYGVEKNWWSRSGSPDKMPIGEIGGPDSEIFYEFTQVEHDTKYGEKCHPNCNCGRFLEIGNSVFIQYQKQKDGRLKELSQKNVDFGGGLERLTAAVNNTPDVFQTDFYSEAIKSLEAIKKTGGHYNEKRKPYQIIVDHLRAAIFMVADGVEPSNKLQGYILRRLIRRAMLMARDLGMEQDEWLSNTLPQLVTPYTDVYPYLAQEIGKINQIIVSEVDKFRKTIKEGLKEEEKIEPQLKSEQSAPLIINQNLEQFQISYKEFEDLLGFSPKSLASVAAGTVAFELQSTYGLPQEEFRSIIEEKRVVPNFQPEEFIKSVDIVSGLHKELSRSASAG
ncbi:MAG: alanine--tRNA ligase-related protein, partial [Candidatus Daviesbacteria bacterium]|nr:alanine--tRNA ligase-related protein [Candidatus Daviesbacteria bacterium]